MKQHCMPDRKLGHRATKDRCYPSCPSHSRSKKHYYGWKLPGKKWIFMPCWLILQR